ncbi:hypothetical protein JCGZ_24611 [Jatropha curcas]|uniref:Fungal lipase-type domain-containing protein n=1 Tax=Jatropha curcas TaxID=180498 RepID=A0A067KWS6_JATCU|nr:hypothetical protein JCGZ_24611 [Jatropha curcas]
MATTEPNLEHNNDVHGNGYSNVNERKFGGNNNNNRNRYLIVSPKKAGKWSLFKYLALGDTKSGRKFLDSSEEEEKDGAVSYHRMVILMSIIVRRILAFIAKPLMYLGFVVDFFLNLLSENGDFHGLLINFLHGKVKIPHRGSETYISTIGQLDGRIDLYKSEKLVKQIDDSVTVERSIKAEMGDLSLMDLSIMASKLAYENARVVKNVMHFVDFYDCWNEYQKESNTQVFICCDKPKDANLIVISFRGTEPFNACDWSTDIDFSWYEIPKVGKIHIGFLEALGLGNRDDADTFQYHLQRQQRTNFNYYNGQDVTPMTNSTSESSANTDSDKELSTWDNPSDSEGANNTTKNRKIQLEMAKKSAYYAVTGKLKSLLKEHKNAKFVVSGHSLGGALAILYPTVLMIQEEMELMEKLLGVYTFGQPRVGDVQLGKFMEAHLNNPIPKYFRVVYCNDVVPRVPFDDQIFSYKHFGVCLYYDSWFYMQKMEEQPNPNFFGLWYIMPLHLNAAWEILRSIAMGYTHGPEYREGWFSTFYRLIGLALPGIAAHSPRDYLNSVRLGKERSLHLSSIKSFLHK